MRLVFFWGGGFGCWASFRSLWNTVVCCCCRVVAGRIWALNPANQTQLLLAADFLVVGFVQDEQKEMYVLDYFGSGPYKIVANATEPQGGAANSLLASNSLMLVFSALAIMSHLLFGK